MRVLVVAPHPDDEAIGCGGALRRHADAGADITAVFLTSGELGLPGRPVAEAHRIREGEAEAAAGLLGIGETLFLRRRDWFLEEEVAEAAAQLAPVLAERSPDVVYVPHPDEWHPDHAASWPITQAAIATVGGGYRPVLRYYEVWSPLTVWDEVQDISAVVAAKLDAVRAHASQAGTFDFARAAEGLAAYRGVLAGRCAYAEVFRNPYLDGDR